MQVKAQTTRFWAPALLLLGVLTAFPRVQSAVDSSKLSPSETVDEFCRLDLAGVRLDSTGPNWAEYAQLIIGDRDWPEEPVKIVVAFHITSVQRSRNTATVNVQYDLRGSLKGALESDELGEERGPETVKFPLLRVHGSWKVRPFELPPHVSVDALRRHVQGIMDSDEKMGDRRRREILQKLLVKLGSLDG